MQKCNELLKTLKNSHKNLRSIKCFFKEMGNLFEKFSKNISKETRKLRSNPDLFDIMHKLLSSEQIVLESFSKIIYQQSKGFYNCHKKLKDFGKILKKDLPKNEQKAKELFKIYTNTLNLNNNLNEKNINDKDIKIVSIEEEYNIYLDLNKEIFNKSIKTINEINTTFQDFSLILLKIKEFEIDSNQYNNKNKCIGKLIDELTINNQINTINLQNFNNNNSNNNNNNNNIYDKANLKKSTNNNTTSDINNTRSIEKNIKYNRNNQINSNKLILKDNNINNTIEKNNLVNNYNVLNINSNNHLNYSNCSKIVIQGDLITSNEKFNNTIEKTIKNLSKQNSNINECSIFKYKDNYPDKNKLKENNKTINFLNNRNKIKISEENVLNKIKESCKTNRSYMKKYIKEDLNSIENLEILKVKAPNEYEIQIKQLFDSNIST